MCTVETRFHFGCTLCLFRCGHCEMQYDNSVFPFAVFVHESDGVCAVSSKIASLEIAIKEGISKFARNPKPLIARGDVCSADHRGMIAWTQAMTQRPSYLFGEKALFFYAPLILR